MPEFIDQLIRIVGSANVLQDPKAQDRYVTDWFKRFRGQALCIVRPGTTAEVAEIVKACRRANVSIVPQGGNTGLVGGALPDESGTQIVLSLERMTAIFDIDPFGKTLVVEAGAILANVQAAATEKDLEFPLSMGSEGSCTIGGMLSTNAGGTAVLRYGNARELCLGLEVVTPSGEVWNGLKSLRKDNTGYDLRDLFIGAEGTLGIITKAVLKLFPAPKARLASMVAVESPEKAIQLLHRAQLELGPLLTAFELISFECLELVEQYFPQFPYPFQDPYPYTVLIEVTDHEDEAHAIERTELLLEAALDDELICDAVLSQNIAQSNQLWDIREHIPLAQVEDGKNIKHDISLPIAKIPEFLDEISKQLDQKHPASRIIAFGHLGDGNLHFNVAAPIGVDPEIFLQEKSDVNTLVHDFVVSLSGSISAEHGVGSAKAGELLVYKQPLELDMFRAIKQALDSNNIMNPGKILVNPAS